MSQAKRVRQARILAELAGSPSLRIADLARLHQVSAETIRRDLDELTRQGLLNRTYGGAVKAAPAEPSLSERNLMFIAERERIAARALRELDGARTLFIGSGSTTLYLARRLAIEGRDMTVLTHSLGVASVLGQSRSVRTLVLPGDYLASEGATVGPHCLDFINGFNVDCAVLGASGLSVDGPTEALLDCSVVYKAMIARATRTLVLADHSKYGQVFPGQYASWATIDGLISDAPPPAELLACIGEHRLHLA